MSALLHEAETRANQLLIEYRDELEKLTQHLIAAEELSESQIADTIGPSVHPLPNEDVPDNQDDTQDEAVVMNEDLVAETTTSLETSPNETEVVPTQQGTDPHRDDDNTSGSY